MTSNDAFNGASGANEIEAAEAVDKSIAEVAANAVDFCQRASDLLRSQAATIKSIAITIETEAEALALDIEKRAQRFTALVEQFSRLSSEVRAVFEQERHRLDGFEIPEADKAHR
jgi:ABC-type transporter Mla subunit MlaD